MLKTIRYVRPRDGAVEAAPAAIGKPGPVNYPLRRGALLIALLILVVALGLVLGHWAGLDRLKSVLGPLVALEEAAPLRFAALFFLANVVVTAACIPIEILFGLAAGALFGVVEGTLLVSFASTTGAMLAFAMSRFMLRNHIRSAFPAQLAMIDRGVTRDGAFYVFSIRLLPLFPFSLINVLMGLTDIGTGKFYLFSQLGMLPATLIYVNAGTQLSQLNSLADIVSPSLVGAFLLLAILPWLGKGLVNLFKARRQGGMAPR